MSRQKKEEGTCKLCLEHKLLTFEHVPPRSTFNKETKYVEVPFHDFIEEENPLDFVPKGKVNQGGTGGMYFCGDCNSFLGREYVPAFREFTHQIAEAMKSLRAEDIALNLEVMAFKPLRFAKQVLSMFLAINPIEWSKEKANIRNAVLKPNVPGTELGVDLFMYMNKGEQLRFIPRQIKSDKGLISVASEITFPPLGYVLVENNVVPDDRLARVSDLFDTVDKTYSKVELGINVLQTHLPMLLDYRTEHEIEEQT